MCCAGPRQVSSKPERGFRNSSAIAPMPLLLAALRAHDAQFNRTDAGLTIPTSRLNDYLPLTQFPTAKRASPEGSCFAITQAEARSRST